jgi:inhibitor of KinA sporulation pathway (predicted exonuclease)
MAKAEKEHNDKNRTIFTALDLEMNQPTGTIIQIGACIGEITTGEVFERFRRYVQITEPLEERIVQLTGVTQKHLDDEGVPLVTAYQELAAIHQKYQTGVNSITWGGDDQSALQEQLWEKLSPQSRDTTPEMTVHEKLGLLGVPWVFGRRSKDVKDTFQFWALANGHKMQGGLARSMVRMGLNFQGRKHDAGDDAFNTFRITHELVKRIQGSKATI